MRVRVGRGVAFWVGGRVDVTKRGGADVGVPTEILIQDVNNVESRKVRIILLDMLEHHHLAFGLFERVACDLLIESLTRQDRDLGQGAQ